MNTRPAAIFVKNGAGSTDETTLSITFINLSHVVGVIASMKNNTISIVMRT